VARILAVDDAAIVLRLETAILHRAGHEVANSTAGPEALKQLGIEPEDKSVELPDLLILDLMMPRMDGYEFAAIIRSNRRTSRIPILVVSTWRAMPPEYEKAVQVDGYLSKPFSPEELTNGVAKILGRRPTCPAPDRA
jgi:CheY-like chemotaxis protein